MPLRELVVVKQTPGWWKVTDQVGDVGYWEFREDGRARMVRGCYWDWCYVQGEWEQVTTPELLEWANMDPKPTATWGDSDYFDARERDRKNFRNLNQNYN